ncbi:hypothetical protein AB5J62_24415 [Amycolatopsis sp. cg5]|uniref:hypothetical protein n=1 Tax=Amycolatopsis sp. cg5 TaxID=3238802 RepID=UPI0035237EB0
MTGEFAEADSAVDVSLRLATGDSLEAVSDVVDELLAILGVVRFWHALNVLLRHRSRFELILLDGYDEQLLFNAAFVEQVAPGRLQRVSAELPAHIEALRAAKRDAV